MTTVVAKVPQRNLFPPITENDLLVGVLDILRVLGFRVVHFRPALTARGYRTAIRRRRRVAGYRRPWPASSSRIPLTDRSRAEVGARSAHRRAARLARRLGRG